MSVNSSSQSSDPNKSNGEESPLNGALTFFNRLKERVETSITRPIPGMVKKCTNTSPSSSTASSFDGGRLSSESFPKTNDSNPSLTTTNTNNTTTIGKGPSSFPNSILNISPNNNSTNQNNNTLSIQKIPSSSNSNNSTNNHLPQPSNPLPPTRKNAPYRVIQFEHFLQAEIVDIIELRKLCWNGIPHHYRPVIWPLLLGYYPQRKSRREETLRRKRLEYHSELIPLHYDRSHPSHFQVDTWDNQTLDVKIYKQILVDLPRTSPNNPFFHQKPVRKVLERVLYIWSIRHPAAGYVQGMNDIISPLILNCCALFVDDPHCCDTTSLDPNIMVSIFSTI
jgi:hypothetical protein